MSSARVEPTEDEVGILGDQGFEEGAPGLLRHGRVLIGEVDDLHAVLAMQPRQLLCEADGIAVPPARPEAALAAIVAEMRAAARRTARRRRAVRPQ